MTDQLTLPHDWWPEPLPTNIVVGERSWLYSSYAFLHYHSQRPCGLQVGHDSGLYIGTLFNLGPEGEVQIGDYCTLAGPIISSNSLVVIRDYAFVAHEVVIADSFAAVPSPDTEEVSQGNSAQVTTQTSVVIGEKVWIGAEVILLAGAHIGEGAIVGSATVVDFEVPDYAIVGGSPARVIGWTWPETKHT